MPQYTIQDFRVTSLPAIGVPNARYYVLNGDGTVDEYITDISGVFHRVLPPLFLSAGTLSSEFKSLTFSNSNNVTFGLQTNGVITASANITGSNNINVSAGTLNTALSQLIFANANGVTFGLNNNTLTATVKTNYLTTAMLSNAGTGFLSTSQSTLFQHTSAMSNYQTTGNYLTTAMLSNANTSFVGLNSALTGNGISATINSSGISLDVPAFLTTAQPVGAYLTTAMQSDAGSNFLSTSQSTLFQPTSLMSNYQSTGNYLTTAMLSNAGSDFIYNTAALNLTNISATLGSNAISLSVAPAAIQSTQPVAASASNGSFLFSTLQFVETNGVSWATSTDGIRASVQTNYQSTGNYLTTAMVSDAGSNFVNTSAGLNLTNISATLGSNSVSLSVAAQSTQPVAASASNGSFLFSTLQFVESNGVTWATSTDGIRASVKTDYLTTAMLSNASTQFVQANAAFAGTNASGTIASNGISVSVNAGGGGAALKGSGTYTQNTGTIEFANSNGITFGLSNNGTMTASHNGLTTAMASDAGSNFVGLNSALTGNGVLATINSSGISLNVPAFLTTAMLSNAATISNINISGGTTSSNLSNFQLIDTNGVSWSLDTASKIYATVKTDYLTTAMASNRGTDFVQATAAFAGTNASGTIASNGISVSVVAQSNPAASASNGSFTFQTLNFSNANNVTFGTSAGGIVTASVAAGGGLTNINLSAGTTSNNASNFTFANSNGVSFGLDAGTITATVRTDYLTTAMASNRGSDFMGTNTALTANGVSMTANSSGLSLNFPAFLTTAALSNHSHGVSFTSGSVAFQTLSFTNSNGISFNSGTQGIFASHNAITTARASNDGVGLNTALTAGPLAWTVNSDGISLNAGSAAGTTSGFGGNLISGSMTHNTAGLNLSLSHPAWLTTAMQTGSQSQLWIMGNSSATVGGTNLSGTMYSNGLSLSVAAPGAAAENNWIHLVGANTADNTTASGSTIGLSGGMNITLGATNGSQVYINGMSFANSNNITFGTNGGTLTASFNPINIGMSTNGNTAGTTGTFDGAGLQYVLIGGSNITLSQSSNGSSVSLSIIGPAAGGFIRSYFNPQDAYLQIGHQQGQATLHMQPMQAPNVTYNRIMIPYLFSGATNSTASVTLSNWIGIYTRNNSTLSLSTSYSSSTAFVHSGTASSNVYNGVRLFSISNAGESISEGQYWVAHISRTTTGGANATFSHMAASQQNSNFSGLFGVITNATNQYTRGLGHYTVSTTGIPSSIAFSQLNGTASAVLRQPLFYFVSGTI